MILFSSQVSHKEQQILIFRLQQNFKVSLLQPSSVTVYEYYNPGRRTRTFSTVACFYILYIVYIYLLVCLLSDHRCTQLYTPVVDKDELTQICEDNVCRCTQGKHECVKMATVIFCLVFSNLSCSHRLQATAAPPSATRKTSPKKTECRLPARVYTTVRCTLTRSQRQVTVRCWNHVRGLRQ